jgi:hypothetical protein
MYRPENMLLYYGWLNSFNSATNGWDNEKVAQDIARYNVAVFGDGVANSQHGDYANTCVIIPRVIELNPNIKIFGYVSVNQSYANFKTKVEEWFALQVDGIFFDEAGYDFGTVSTNGREAINSKLDLVHSCGMIAMLNAWKIEHLFGVNGDASYPDSTWNSNDHLLNHIEEDYYLLESSAITATGTYESKTQWYQRCYDAVELRDEFKFKIAALSCVNETDNNADEKVKFAFISAVMWSLDLFGISDYDGSTSYGASNAKTKLWERPALTVMHPCYREIPTVVDIGSNAYKSFLSHGNLKLDFTASSEASFINVYEA